VKTVTDATNVSMAPLDADVNSTMGRAVVSPNVAVMGDAYPTIPVPVIATVWAINDVLDESSDPDVTPYTSVNVNDVEAALDGVHVNVNM